MAVNQFQPGMSVQQMYDNIDNHALSGWSDSSKTAFMNYFNAENANQHEIEMWRLNNEYNTPEKQVQRLVEAGLNPAVAYDKVSSGTSSSAPGTHKADSTNFHDTKDKLDRINTIMSGISSIIGSIGSAVGAAGGIQDMALKHQNNFLGELRSTLWHNMNHNISQDLSIFKTPYEVAPGLYTEAVSAQLYPELYKAFNSSAYATEIKSLLSEYAGNADKRQQGLYEKQTRIDNLIQGIFKDLDTSSPDIGSIIRKVLELIVYQSAVRF